MASFGKKSYKVYETLDPRLQDVVNLAIKIMDFSLLSGYRGKAEQDRYFKMGTSLKQFPESKHNRHPSIAVDLAPYPIDWTDTQRFYVLAGVMLACALVCKVKLRWGGDWDSDGDLQDQSFQDLGHFEIVED
ncbi:MAG: M15 family metallopeptidase [Candidatus Thorarchaeota archaeon]|jgi:peptidoglycan L-alanyl-D-glutamate endopeptidase CwlK